MPRVLAPGAAQLAAQRLRDKIRFGSDPVAWMRERLGRVMWSKPQEIARSIVANRYTAVHAGHGLSKSFTAGDLVAWWIATHPPGTAVVVTTAPTNKQVKKILWKEIGRAQTKGKLPGYVTQDAEWKMEIGGNIETVAFGRKPADHDLDGFQGIHEEFVLVIIDEACGVPEQIWTAIDTLVTNAGSRVLAIGNPDNPSTHFREVCKPGSGWNVIHVSVFDWLAEREKYPELQKHLTGPEWVEERRKRWGVGSPLWQAKVEGVFPDVADDMLITPAMLHTAYMADFPGRARGNYALDVARFGADETVCYRNRGGVIRFEWRLRKVPTTTTTGHAMRTLRPHVGHAVMVVDGVGVGGGVVDSLVEQGQPIIDYNGGLAPRDPERFLNKRAEDYWEFRDAMEAGEIDLDPEDTDLANQLQSIKWALDSKGRIKIESKDDMRKRGVPSPDRADTAVMAWVGGQTNTKTGGVLVGGPSLTEDLMDRPM